MAKTDFTKKLWQILNTYARSKSAAGSERSAGILAANHEHSCSMLDPISAFGADQR
jgi:hypothetical protein